MFLKIDDWLFDRVFQPFTDWFCDRTGKGPLWLAGTSAYLIMIAAVLTHMFTLVSFTLSGIIFLIGFIYVLNSNWNNKYSRQRPGTLNPKRQDMFARLFRLSYLVLFAIASWILIKGIIFSTNVTVGVILVTEFAGLVCANYFGACETKPPAPPKKKGFRSNKLARASL